MDFEIWALIISALAVLAIAVVVLERFVPRTAPVPAATDTASGASAEAPVQAAAKSIAVLPFADMSAGRDQSILHILERADHRTVDQGRGRLPPLVGDL